jgi:hypothetical protein
VEWRLFQIIFWVIAGLVSFYFSLGNARVWTSIAVGFFLVLIGEILPQTFSFLPGAGIPQVEAMAHIVGTIAILVMCYGFQEYYVFSRTLELEGNKAFVYLATFLVIAASFAFILINPAPSAATLRSIRLVENTNWVFLSLINIDLVGKIYLNMRDSPIARAFIAFIGVFVFFLLWKGSELYLQVYDLRDLSAEYPFRYHFSIMVNNIGNLLASLSVGGTFLYLARLLR